MSLLEILREFPGIGPADATCSAVHSGNLGDIIYSLPTARALGVNRLILNLVEDPGVGNRRLTRAGAEFLAPLLAAQPWIASVAIARVDVALAGGAIPNGRAPVVSSGLPLELVARELLGVDHVLDRFRLEPTGSMGLVEAHARAMRVSLNRRVPVIARSAEAPRAGGILVALTTRYRHVTNDFMARLLSGFGPLRFVGEAADRGAYDGLEGDFIIPRDAVELARMIESADLFIGNPSLPFAIAEGLAHPRLVDMPDWPINSFPIWPNGFALPADLGQGKRLIEALLQGGDAAARLTASVVPSRARPPKEKAILARAVQPTTGATLGHTHCEVAREPVEHTLTLTQPLAYNRLDLAFSLDGWIEISEIRLARRDDDASAEHEAVSWPLTGSSPRLVGEPGRMLLSGLNSIEAIRVGLPSRASGGLREGDRVSFTVRSLTATEIATETGRIITEPATHLPLVRQAMAHKAAVESELGTALTDAAHLTAQLDEARHALETTEARRAHADQRLAIAEFNLEQTRRSTSWRLTAPVRMVGQSIRRARAALRRRVATHLHNPILQTGTYHHWIARWDTLTAEDRAAITRHISELVDPPLISIVMPTYNTRPEYLRLALQSISDQLYPHWELCVADDASTNPETIAVLDAFANRDSRVKLVKRPTNGHISAASNSALALATGRLTALVDHDDTLPPHALYMVAIESLKYPDAEVFYSDEDKIDAAGVRYQPYFKSDWNEELFYGQNMISHLGVYSTALLNKIGGFRLGFEGSQDYDLALRATAATKPENIRHIPHVLYHWRVFKESGSFSTDQLDRAVDAARRAIEESLLAKGERDFTIVKAAFSFQRIKRAVPNPAPLVSLLIPTRDRVDLLRDCVAGILDRTDYKNIEILIIDNDSRGPETLAYFEQMRDHPKLRVIHSSGPFNYSALNNLGVELAKGEIIGLINNDIDVIESDWLDEMVAQAVRPNVGAVGAKLLYANDTIQHGGVILGIGGIGSHAHKGWPATDAGYFGRLALVQNFSAVTAACMLLRREVYCQVGGLDEANLAVAFNDVDLCLRIREAGYDIVWTPAATLYHKESASRGRDVSREKAARFNAEIDFMKKRWGPVLRNDPFYNPNLTLWAEDFSLSDEPRRERPWVPYLIPAAD